MQKHRLLALLVAVALLSIGAACSFQPANLAVPITLQSFFVMLVASLLPTRMGFLAILIYLMLGVMGFPVFANFSSGWSVFTGKSMGFFLGFLLTPLFLSNSYWKKKESAWLRILEWVLAHLVILILGFLLLAMRFGFSYLNPHSWIQLFPGLVLKSLIGGCSVHFLRKTRIFKQWHKD